MCACWSEHRIIRFRMKRASVLPDVRLIRRIRLVWNVISNRHRAVQPDEIASATCQTTRLHKPTLLRLLRHLFELTGEKTAGRRSPVLQAENLLFYKVIEPRMPGPENICLTRRKAGARPKGEEQFQLLTCRWTNSIFSLIAASRSKPTPDRAASPISPRSASRFWAND
jgi:hypothetical protein